MIQHGGSSQQGAMAMATSRQAAETQAAMIVAKNYPRDETLAISRLLKSCKRKGLAECSMYSYPKGGTKVTGSSIRLAEAMAQAWGNIDYGVIELEQKPGESVAMAYAWDLETNTRRQMVFTVPHIRSTKQGNVLLTDPRDIYEMVANQGARRVRACILGVIPGDIEDLAVAECEKTLKDGSGKPLDDRIRDMVIAFEELRVSREMLEARLQHPVAACVPQDVVSMTKIYLSIRDGISKREDWFDMNAGAAKLAQDAEAKAGGSRTEALAKKTAPKKEKPAEAPPEPPPVKPLVTEQDFAEAIVGATSAGELQQIWDQIQPADLDGDAMTRLLTLVEVRHVEIKPR
jgi:hypothetical protein